MDWKRAVAEERAALMRLAALLHALAGLAEIAAESAPAVRGFVLWLLRRVEPVSRAFLADVPDISPAPIAPAGNRPEDAMRLAAALRSLAHRFEAQTALLVAVRDRPTARTGRDPGARRMPPTGPAALGAIASLTLSGARPARAPDTS